MPPEVTGEFKRNGDYIYLTDVRGLKWVIPVKRIVYVKSLNEKDDSYCFVCFKLKKSCETIEVPKTVNHILFLLTLKGY